MSLSLQPPSPPVFLILLVFYQLPLPDSINQSRPPSRANLSAYLSLALSKPEHAFVTPSPSPSHAKRREEKQSTYHQYTTKSSRESPPLSTHHNRKRVTPTPVRSQTQNKAKTLPTTTNTKVKEKQKQSKQRLRERE